MKWTEPPAWLEWNVTKWLRNPYVQLRFGAIGMIVTTIAWVPLRFMVVALGEPEIVFHLSMLAIWVSAITVVLVTDVGERVD